MYTIGTAGHIDHGKTTLCKLLTGVDTDRLQEEKARGISIDIGFANLLTPGGRAVGIVDVPGHERFIKNMVAGVSGIEAVLFVIAADEGVMPQTREHMDILRLLGVTRGIIVLTKCDLVEPDWLKLVREDIQAYLKDTPFAKAPIAEVARDRPESLKALVAQIDEMLGERRAADTSSLFRLPIDRVFTLKGHGTIVTGTVISGRVKAGDQVELLPGNLTSRVRSVQTFYHTEQEVIAGQRGALNLPDVEPSQLARGFTAATLGAYRPTPMVDVRLTLLKGLPTAFQKLKTMTRVRYYSGTTEAIGRLHLLEGKEIEGGQEQVVQLRFESPVVACKGDRYLLRSFSPVLTIGGGVVLDPYPTKHKKDAQVVARLSKLSESTPGSLLADALARAESPMQSAADLAARQAWTSETTDAALAELGEALGSVERRKKRYYFLKDRLAREGARMRQLVHAYHEANPLSVGMDRGALQQQFNARLDVESFNDLLAQVAPDQQLLVEAALVREEGFEPKLDPQTQAYWNNIEKMLTNEHFLTQAEIFAGAAMKKPAFEKLFSLMFLQRKLVKLPNDIVVLARSLETYERAVVDLLSTRELASTGDIKERLLLTRKALIPLLEYWDAQGLTVRVGNDRKLRQKR